MTQDTQESQGTQATQASKVPQETQAPQSLQGNERSLKQAPSPTLPLEDYILEAARIDAEWLRRSEGKGRRAGWEFVRALKARPDLRAKRTALAAWKSIAPAITKLLEGSPCPGTEHLREIGSAEGDLAATFVLNWKKCRMVYGETEIDRASELAKLYPLSRGDDEDLFEHLESYRRVLSLAGWLQWVRGDRPIFLPVRKVGELAGCSHERAAELIRLACSEGYLAPGERSDRAQRRAAEFRFRVEFFPMLRTGPPLAA